MKIREIICESETLPNENSLGKPIAHSPEALKNFWAWFKGSKVVDSQGRPLVVYHGTDKKFKKINLKKGAMGTFWFTSDKSAIESGNVGASGHGVIMELYVNIQNPANWKQYDQLMLDEFKSRGLDGALLPEADGSLVGFIINSHTQVKSATSNKGTFNGNTTLDEDDDYRGTHTAPDREQGSPLYDLTANYTLPADLYHAHGLYHYGSGGPDDAEAYRVIRAYHNKPNAYVTIYRAVPDALKGLQRKITSLEKQIKMYMSRGKLPSDAGLLKPHQWYEWATEELERLQSLPQQPQPKYTINPGDWVSISKIYAKSHGHDHLQNEYKILSKKVKAKDIFCVGDLTEWGYDPDGT